MNAINFGHALSPLLFCAIPGTAIAADPPNFPQKPPVKDDGTMTTVSFDLPFSSFASETARESFIKRLRSPMSLGGGDIASTRKGSDERLIPQLEYMKSLYPYKSTKSTIGGVPVETLEPAAGIARENKDRVLIELHGGGFVAGGGGPGGAIESIPVVGEGRIKVVAVDYRLAPEHRFPAASEDVAAVYRELLKTYRPENIGIFGCSAGGMLSGQSIAWFLKEKLPLPGAVGVFCASLHTFGEGDSAQLWTRMGSVIPIVPPAKPDGGFGRNSAYFVGASPKDPLAVPAASKEVLKKFPPTLFLTGTRAPEMSAAAQSHLELRELGVKSELYLFDGLDHGFFADARFPESRLAFKLMTRFFAENLGAKGANRSKPWPIRT
jgi:monoterpene epsilon-lactone hydrolase